MAPLSLPMRPSICLRPFIICLSCAYCFRSRLTSATCEPLPFAMRARRLPLMIAGLTRYTNKGHLARAVLEATAFQTREVVEAMEKDAGRNRVLQVAQHLANDLRRRLTG